MNIFADRYQFRARIAPEFLTLFPLILVWTVSTDACPLLGLGLVALFFVFLQGQYSSNLGRKLQSRLRDADELPSGGDYVFDLCHTADRTGKRYSKLFQEAVRKSGMENPFSTKDKGIQKDQTEDILIWLRANTCDKERFPAVFDKNCDYGFYRNMLALRPWAIRMTFLALALLVYLSVRDWPNDLAGYLDLQVWLFKNVNPLWFAGVPVWIGCWFKAASKENLDEASKQYLRTLLRAVQGLDTENADEGSRSN